MSKNRSEYDPYAPPEPTKTVAYKDDKAGLISDDEVKLAPRVSVKGDRVLKAAESGEAPRDANVEHRVVKTETSQSARPEVINMSYGDVKAAPDTSTGAPTPVVKTTEVPDGTVDEVLDWVGDDPKKAKAALKVEKKQDKPRVTLVEALEEISGSN